MNDKMNRNHAPDASEAALASKIKALSFAKTETELFLDTHPSSRAALAYYHETLTELNKLKEEYNDKYGPLTADASSKDKWNWISGPWPWQRPDDENTKGDM